MALVTEDGTGLADAESFASVATADTYFGDRGVAAWASLDVAAQEAALRLGTDYMEAQYGLLWAGERKTTTQALSWPRVGWTGVPEAVQRACCELAIRASAGPLLVDQGPQVEKETVGPISVTYATGARQETYYGYVWKLLAPFLVHGLPVLRA